MKWETVSVLVVIATTVMLMCVNHAMAQSEKPGDETMAQSEKPGDEKLVIIWSSADRDVALNMAFMYASNSKKYGWWDDITFVVWGPSAKLLTEDQELQEHITRMIDAGIVVKACKSCSDNYGVSGKLEKLGIIVKYMQELTDYIKEGRNILTF